MLVKEFLRHFMNRHDSVWGLLALFDLLACLQHIIGPPSTSFPHLSFDPRLHPDPLRRSRRSRCSPTAPAAPAAPAVPVVNSSRSLIEHLGDEPSILNGDISSLPLAVTGLMQ